ncbi:acyltransferase family protein [Nonomuraea phyllanthi]|uniref:Acyltransferase family protein n=1 Tax=Nonomuraea phyllanthi TaxID=2219224 RepID=A0A5C4WA16_9ACTN|nr:acyltransferase family protein [Nonomuraea phyllanthi]
MRAPRATPFEALRGLARRVDSETPPGRDRAVDALRALAIGGVVLGHWLVTAIVYDSGTLRTTSPLRHLPGLAPASWLFQTLAVFFLVGGYAAARSRSAKASATSSSARARAGAAAYRRWLGARLARLFRPVVAVVLVWSAAAVAMLAAGAEAESVRGLVKLVVSPMWFLLVFAVLTAATPLVSRLHPLWPLAVVASVDAVRYGLPQLDGGPAWLGWVNVVAGWLVPYSLGAAWAEGRLRSRTAGWVLLLGGTAGAAGLVAWAGYPAAMVGVPGAAISNLDPPTLAAVAFGLAQCGAALLLLGPLRRVLRRPVAWAAVALVNLYAMTIFLWHQTAMIMVMALGLLAGRRLPGLHTVPDGPGWVVARLGWLPVFGLALVVCWTAFHRYERRPARIRRAPSKQDLISYETVSNKSMSGNMGS